MTGKPETPLQLTEQDVLLKNIASNFERHGEECVPVLDITWETIVPPAVMVGLLGEYCERVLFNRKGELLEPSEVFKRSALPVAIAEQLVARYVAFTLSDGFTYEFGEEPEEGEEPEASMLCPITKLAYEPKIGGGVWLGGSVRIRPSEASEYWAFLEHQKRHAKLTISDSAVKAGNGRQQSLPLQQPEPPAQPGEGFAAGAAARAQAAEPQHEQAVEAAARAGASDVTAPPDDLAKSNTTADAEQKFADDIGPETRAELERVKSRRGHRPIDGRKGAH